MKSFWTSGLDHSNLPSLKEGDRAKKPLHLFSHKVYITSTKHLYFLVEMVKKIV